MVEDLTMRGTNYVIDPRLTERGFKQVDLVNLFPWRSYPKQRVDCPISLPDASSVLESWSGEEFQYQHASISTTSYYIPYLTTAWELLDREHFGSDVYNQIEGLLSRRSRLAMVNLQVKADQCLGYEFSHQFQGTTICGLYTWSGATVSTIDDFTETTLKQVIERATSTSSGTSYEDDPSYAYTDFKGMLSDFAQCYIPVRGTILNLITLKTAIALGKNNSYGRSAYDDIASLEKRLGNVSFQWILANNLLGTTVESTGSGCWMMIAQEWADVHVKTLDTGEQLEAYDFRDRYRMEWRYRLPMALGITRPNGIVRIKNIFYEG